MGHLWSCAAVLGVLGSLNWPTLWSLHLLGCWPSLHLLGCGPSLHLLGCRSSLNPLHLLLSLHRAPLHPLLLLRCLNPLHLLSVGRLLWLLKWPLGSLFRNWPELPLRYNLVSFWSELPLWGSL